MQEMQRTARRKFVPQTRTRALAVSNTGEDRLSIMNSLSKFAGSASEASQQEMRTEIETKKALGASRAAQDLLVAEQNRQGITEDDVLATKLSYNAVIGRHDTINAGNDFVEWYQANPEASDKEIEEKKAELYKPIFAKYSGDEDSVKQISLQVQESQFNLMPVQEKIKQEHRAAKNQEAYRISIGDNLSDPNADMDYLLDEELPTIAKQLGISEFDAKSMVLTEMQTRAKDGDGRLVKALESRDWAKGLEVTHTSRSLFDRKKATEDAANMAKVMADNEMQFLSGNMSEAAFLKYTKRLNEQYGEYNPYSSGSIQSLLMQRQRLVAKGASDTDVMTRYAKRAGSNNPLGTDTSVPEEEKKVIMQAKEAEWVMTAEHLRESGKYSDTDIDNIILKDKVKWSQQEQLVLPDLKAQLSSLLMFDPSVAKTDETVTGRWENDTKILQAMPPALLSQYLSDDETKYALAVKSNLDTMRPIDAFQFAYNAKFKPSVVTPKYRKEYTNQLESTFKDEFKSGFFARMLGDSPTVSAEQQSTILGQLQTRANELARGGISDSKKLASFIVDEFKNNHIQLPNGSITNITPAKLQSNLLRDSDVKELSSAQMTGYMDTWLKHYATTKSNYLNEGVDVSDLVIQFNNDGSTFSVTDKSGLPLDSGYLTTQIFEIARPEDLAKTAKLTEEGYQSRKTKPKKIEAWERRGFFY